MAKAAAKNGSRSGSRELTTPQSEGIFDAEGNVNFEPPVGEYAVVGTKPMVFALSEDKQSNWASRYTFFFKISESAAENEEDYTGRYWNHSVFISRDPDKARYGKNEVKDIFRACQVKLTKNAQGKDVYDPEDFNGAECVVRIAPSIDRETGGPKYRQDGITPFVNRRWAAPSEEA